MSRCRSPYFFGWASSAASSPIPSVSAWESPTKRTRVGVVAYVAGTADVMAVAGTTPVAAAPTGMVSAAGKVARTMARITTPSAGTVKTWARKRVKNVPCRIGRSTK